MDRVQEIFRTHPAPASDAGDEAFALVRAAAECALCCTACADACLEEAECSSLRQCIRGNLDCADVCQAMGSVIARPGKQDTAVLRALLEACATACRSCALECERHAEMHEHCRICAQSCRACAEACDRMTAALVA
jgi:uncharacterized membrane protein